MYIKMKFQDKEGVMEVGEADNTNHVRISVNHFEDENTGWFIDLDKRAVWLLRDWLTEQLKTLPDPEL